MTDEEMEKLAVMIAEKMPSPHQCIAFSEDTIRELDGFAKVLKSTKKTALATFIGLVVMLVVTALITGIVYELKKRL